MTGPAILGMVGSSVCALEDESIEGAVQGHPVLSQLETRNIQRLKHVETDFLCGSLLLGHSRPRFRPSGCLGALVPVVLPHLALVFPILVPRLHIMAIQSKSLRVGRTEGNSNKVGKYSLRAFWFRVTKELQVLSYHGWFQVRERVRGFFFFIVI